MMGVSSSQWGSLAQWSPIALVVSGIGSLIIVTISVGEIVVYGQRFSVLPEWGLSLIVIPSLLITFIGLLGFYPYIADASRWLARGGVVAAAVGLLSLIVTVIGGLVLHLLGIEGFTEEGNPVILGFFFLMFIALLLTFLLYGVASVWTNRPSRIVGLLLLVPIVEPLSVFIIDILGVGIPGGPLTTLGVQGVAFIAVGYLLRTQTEPVDYAEPMPDSPA